jgi:hypothetical protein
MIGWLFILWVGRYLFYVVASSEWQAVGRQQMDGEEVNGNN